MGRCGGLLSRGKKIEAITERVQTIMGPGKGSNLIHIGISNAEREGTTAVVKKYRQFLISCTKRSLTI